jgi:GAF domain-containing protein
LPIIVYGLLTDSEGRPVAVDVYPGNTGDPTTVPDQVEKLRQRFGLSRVVLVGDRGMLTETQIGKLKQHPGLGWISALRGPAIRELVESGSLQLSLFDEMNLAEISSPDYPGERLVACFNPLLADERRRKRGELIQATEKDLGKIAAQVKRRTRTPLGEAEIASHVYSELDLERRALLLHGKADRHRWQILRERDDVESAISAPLLHGERVLGVLNLSHARNQRQFDAVGLLDDNTR